MPDKKIIHVPDVGVVEFPHDMHDVHIAHIIKSHKDGPTQASLPPSPSVSIVGRESSMSLPPEIERIRNAVGAQLVQGRPYGDAIASVADHEPHKIEINDSQRFAQGGPQTVAHEVTHLFQNQLPGGLQSKILPDNPSDPYNIDHIDELRKQGHTIATLPREVGASIVQRYVASPADRPRLQKWIDDMAKTPLSIMQPTSPSDKTINRAVRPPQAPPEGYQSVQELKAQAAALQEKFKPANPAEKQKSSLPSQPKEALNQYPNPEDRPPKESFAFNKAWSKPGPYAAKLAPQEETEFRKWAAANPQSIRGEVGPAPNFDPLPMADYDVRAHFHAAKVGDPAATLVPNKWDGKIHGNDKFKTPYNGGFSNESMYALPNAPRWVGDKLMTHDGKLVTDETPRKATK